MVKFTIIIPTRERADTLVLDHQMYESSGVWESYDSDQRQLQYG